MFNVILIFDNNFGIGKDNNLPWNFKKDMEYFKNLTTSKNIFEKSIVIMGRNTMESLPKKSLQNRINIIISNTLKNEKDNNKIIVNNFQNALDCSYNINGKDSENIWVIGGAQLYQEAFNHRDINSIYYTHINGDFDCDTFIVFPWNLEKYNITSYITDENNKKDNKNYKLSFNKIIPYKNAENQYLNLLEEVMVSGKKKLTRNGYTYSLFSKELNFDISENFPLLTTKRMFWKGIVEELLFFIRGETNTTMLSSKGIKIWEGNTSREFLDSLQLPYQIGDMGPMYGYQWRYFNKNYQTGEGGIDQLKNIIKEIKQNPNSRRLIMTDFNPSQVDQGVLYPCHSLILQFYVQDDTLSVKMYQRSADIFLGLPFNIASTSLLLCIIARLTKLKPKNVTISLGDCHIYEDHMYQCQEQLSRKTFLLPKLEFPNFTTLEEIEHSTFNCYKLIDYNYHPSIKAKMIA